MKSMERLIHVLLENINAGNFGLARKNIDALEWIKTNEENQMSNLSPHFTLAEMTKSEYAVRNEIDNTPDELVALNLAALCKNVLEPLRDIVKKPIHINSGYRSPKVNAGIGGASKSQHVEGKAADIEVDGMSIDELFDIACKFTPFDQCIHEFNSWVHISYNGDKNRKQILWAVKKDGKTQYLTEKP